MYISDASNVFSLSYCIGYASAFSGMALYWVFTPSLKGLISELRKRTSTWKVSQVT